MGRWIALVLVAATVVELGWLAFKVGRAGIGPRLLLSLRIGPWFGLTMVSIGIGLWAARQIDRVKAGELPREAIGEYQSLLLVSMIVFMIALGITIWRLPLRRRHDPEADGVSDGPTSP